jgi:hypothetical protein
VLEGCRLCFKQLRDGSNSPLLYSTPPMNRILKTLLLWLLIAALPLQGLAATIQSSCGPSHHASMMSDVPASIHQHGDGMTHSHGGDERPAQALADDASSPVQASGDGAQPSKHATSSCSACAVCCVGAVAPPSVSLWTPVYSSSESVISSPDPLITGFIPASLERPPKRLSA